ncbi:MAG: hypothetical protein ACKPEO_22730, partial [Sphaerospermopsis kisseleviana]
LPCLLSLLVFLVLPSQIILKTYPCESRGAGEQGSRGAGGKRFIPVTSHQSPVTSHQSPVTSHQSPVTSH